VRESREKDPAKAKSNSWACYLSRSGVGGTLVQPRNEVKMKFGISVSSQICRLRYQMTCSLSVNRILRVEATSNRTNAVLQVFVTASGQLLGFVDASDALCKGQLKERSKELPSGSPWTTDAEFEAITVYFEPPSEDERFNVVRHERA